MLRRLCVLLSIAASSASAQAPLPANAEARSLLGQPLVPPMLAETTRALYLSRLAEARKAFEHTPQNADSVIWLGRRTAYLGRYREAIAIFSDGARLHPTDARMYRHRGHRYLTTRQLDQAISDFEKARALIAGTQDQVEPDGIPNARGIPTSTLHSNIRYHLGLAHYLKGDFEAAGRIFAEDVAAALAADNADMLVASSHWLYMALRRSGQDALAAEVLTPIKADLPVIENGSYHRLLLLYQGLLPVDSLLRSGNADATVEDVTLAYGVGNWHFYNGRADAARQIWTRMLRSPQWAVFGYLAAEAEIARKPAP